MASALDRARDEASILQHTHVFGGARKTHAERGRKFPDREFPFRELAKHGPAGRVREGMKDGVEMGMLFNHVVQHSRPSRIVNRSV